MDERGGHGRRHQILHRVIVTEEGRVLLQDMVLRQEDFQITGDRHNIRTTLGDMKYSGIATQVRDKTSIPFSAHRQENHFAQPWGTNSVMILLKCV